MDAQEFPVVRRRRLSRAGATGGLESLLLLWPDRIGSRRAIRKATAAVIHGHMIPVDLEALALADSVGALDTDEQAELEARRAGLSPEEQAEVARIYEAATALATGVDGLAPRAHVRERVLAAARTPAPHTG